MVKTARAAQWLFSCLAAFFVTAMIRAQDVDLVLANGNIYTVHDKQPKAEAIAVKGNRIVFVGSNEDAKKFHAPKVIDLRGRTLVPGLTDSHCHIFGIGEREMRLNLEGANTLGDFLNKVKARVAQTSTGKWITGRGLIETFWKPSKFPTRQDLDKIAPDNPVFFTRADGHASVANSAALRIAKIDRNTPDPFGGQILKSSGEPNGMLLDNAQELVSRNIPKPTEAEREEALLRGINREIGLGWCEIQNAGSDSEDIDLLRKDFEAGKIKIRFINAVYGPAKDAQNFLREGATINAFDHHFTQRTIKVIFDGALGSRGAALLKPYADAPDTSGYLTEKPEELKPMFGSASQRHSSRDTCNRRPCEPADPRSLRTGVQSCAAECAKNSRAALACRARADSRSGGHSALRETRCDPFDAAVARNKRSIFRTESSRN